MVDTILSRVQPSHSQEKSHLQSQVDDLVGSFTERATDWRSLAAVVAGGIAYQWGRIGAVATKTGDLASLGIGLGTEVTAFEMTNRSLVQITGEGAQNHNLWRWGGAGGIRQGLLSSLITFGTLKGAGHLAQGENIIVQHLLQDTGMVLGHQVSGAFGVTERPTGSFAEQFLHAEATNLQLGAAMALGRGFSPFQAETGMGPRMRPQGVEKKSGFFSILPSSAPLAVEGGGQLSMMSQMGPGGAGGDGGGRRSEGASRNSSPPLSDPLIGKTIDGRYTIEAVIGHGGMGTVYRCTRKVLGKKVAIKVLQSHLSRDPKILERFLGEAKAASALLNPHIIEVIDIGQLPDQSPYFVMEHLEGVPLSKLLEKGRAVPVPRLLSIAHQIAEGLSAAHKKDIIHRDLKPGNIFLVNRDNEKDFVKILDFGIAKMLNNVSSDLTLAGDILGTPKYMSPEQAGSRPVDQRSDIYSFGVLLYKMASGRAPFEHGDILSLIRAHVHEAPTPIRMLDSRPQEVPEGLDAIVLKCLAKNPEERYQFMDEVIADLDRLMEELKSPSTDVPLSLTIRKPALVRVEQEPTPRVRTAPVSTLPQLKEPRRSRWPLILGVTGVGAASVLAAAILSGRRFDFGSVWPDSSPPSPPPTSAPIPQVSPTTSPTTSPTMSSTTSPMTSPTTSQSARVSIPSIQIHPASKKKIELTIDPPDAHVFREGKDQGANPTIEIEESSTVKLEIRREGFKTKQITLDGSVEKQSIRLEQDIQTAPRPRPSHTTQPPPTKDPKNEFQNFE